MAVPTITSTTVNAQASAQTSLTFNMPALRPDDDLFIAIGFKDDNPAFTGKPDNWTEIFQTPDATNVRLAAWWWIGSTEPSSYAVNMDSEVATAVVLHIEAFNPEGPIDDFDTATGSSTDALAPESTVTVSDTLVIRAAVVDRDAITVTPATELTKGGAGGANDIGWGASEEPGPASGGTGTEAFTNATDEWVAATIVIAPHLIFVADDLSDVVFSLQGFHHPPIEI